MTALQSIAASFPDESAVMLSQARAARVSSRQNTGAGQYTKFVVEGDVSRLAQRVYPGPYATLAGLRYQVSFILFAQDGLLSTLECAAGGDDTENIDFEHVEFDFKY